MAGLSEQAREFREILERHKSGDPNIRWYPYESLASIPQLDRLLEGHPGLIDQCRSLPLLDLGCGDGDVSFFLESLGFSVTAVDFDLTNFNRMEGVRAMKRILGSRVEIQSVDLDGRGAVPRGPFGLCLVLGLLYHVKNPFYLLEYAAQNAQYCFLSTRIAQRTPQKLDLGGEALAYLVDFEELNQDRTNFWIFSREGLNRLVRRAGWTICGYQASGNTVDSDPVNPDRDERAWLLLRSRMCRGARVDLGEGWYDQERGTYRWTNPAFGVTVADAAGPGAMVEFRFTSAHPMRMSARAGTVELPPAEYPAIGNQTYSATLPRGFSGEILFHVEPGLHVEGDVRDLGVQVTFWRSGTETSDTDVPIEIVY